MPDGNIPLRTVLVESYERLLQLLERRLLSRDLAREALHDTYLQLERGKEIRPIEHPLSYLFRIALNVARGRQRAGRRLLSVAEIEETFDLVDDTPSPAKTVEDRSELEAFERAFAALPPRRQAILLASFSENLSSTEIARRFGLSKRMIDMELKLARETCAGAIMKWPKK
jgi:RNA polymerase sigma-70 factor (ECF subfamily)